MLDLRKKNTRYEPKTDEMTFIYCSKMNIIIIKTPYAKRPEGSRNSKVFSVKPSGRRVTSVINTLYG